MLSSGEPHAAEPSPPQRPPALVVTATGDTIYTRGGRTITHVIILNQTSSKLTYEGFFDHPTSAQTFTRTIPMTDVARIERSSEDDHKRLRNAWERQIALAEKYRQDIKRCGWVMFRGEWVSPEHVERVRQAEQRAQAQWMEARAAELDAAFQQAQAATDEQRRWIAASLRLGQDASVLNLLGPPTSRREFPLAMGILQTEASWNNLGLRVIVQNGIIAFIEQYQPATSVAELPSSAEATASIRPQTTAQQTQAQ